MYKPEGIYVAMLTPFSDDGEINEEELRRIVEFLIQSGVHGLFPVSSVGEFIHMSREEKIRMILKQGMHWISGGFYMQINQKNVYCFMLR